PDLSGVTLNSYKGQAERIIRTARDEGLTLRQAAYRFGDWRSQFIGSPETVADRLQEWFEDRAADGFIIFEPLPGQLEAFVDKVVPILQARGLFRT
ncbi:MAG: LLM class flavin-dependent oxidoreductase, partial [Sphingobium yanoikuyae]|nr:LLM class flavin-dependent oxidoreductase [Sphingobium yanoikuyae]